MLSKESVVIAAASAGVCFIGYCIYFDHKRRSDPYYKQKVMQKRKSAKMTSKHSTDSTQIPDLRDSDALQKFFVQEIQTGEELLAQGDIENAVEHFCLAIAVCGQPQQLLQVLQQTTPPQIFQLIIQRLPQVSHRINSSAMGAGEGMMGEGMVEDDLE